MAAVVIVRFFILQTDHLLLGPQYLPCDIRLASSLSVSLPQDLIWQHGHPTAFDGIGASVSREREVAIILAAAAAPVDTPCSPVRAAIVGSDALITNVLLLLLCSDGGADNPPSGDAVELVPGRSGHLDATAVLRLLVQVVQRAVLRPPLRGPVMMIIVLMFGQMLLLPIQVAE